MLGVGRVIGAAITVTTGAAAGITTAALGGGPISILVAGGVIGGLTQLMGSVKDLKQGLRCASTLALGIMAGAGSAAVGVAVMPESAMETLEKVVAPIKKILPDSVFIDRALNSEIISSLKEQHPGWTITI